METEEKPQKEADSSVGNYTDEKPVNSDVGSDRNKPSNEDMALVHQTTVSTDSDQTADSSTKSAGDSGIFGMKNEGDHCGEQDLNAAAGIEFADNVQVCEETLISQEEDKHRTAEDGTSETLNEITKQSSDIQSSIDTTLYFDIKNTQWPIVYTSDYNIGFLGLEKLHPFDAGKWGRVNTFLKDGGMTRDDTIVKPREAQETDLLVVHTKKYLDSLKWSINVAQITEIPPVAFLPNFIVQRRVLKPFRFHVGGTILAGKLAVERGWAINIGGGFHHCSAEKGGGFCAYADITLTIKFLFNLMPEKVKKAMIIDLDAHQGNGHERDFMDDERVYILDMYNRGIYPHDGFAKRAIRRKVELSHFTGDDVYLELVKKHVRKSFEEFTPDVVVYNAGTDILEGDPLGLLSISPEGIIERDRIVFQETRSRDIPVIMVTSGGYQKRTARIIADSILNLRRENLIVCEDAEKLPRSKSDDATSTSPAMPRSRSDGSLWARFRDTCITMTHSATQDQLQENVPH